MSRLLFRNKNIENGNLTLCQILIQTHELLTPKLGENGAGVPPAFLATKTKNETISKTEDSQNLLDDPHEGMKFLHVIQ